MPYTWSRCCCCRHYHQRGLCHERCYVLYIPESHVIHTITLQRGITVCIFLKTSFSLFLERGEWMEKNINVRDKHRMIASQTHPGHGQNQPLRHVPWPDWEANQQPFALWNDAQPTEPHWSELLCIFKMSKLKLWKVMDIFYSFNINNDLLSTYSITVLGAVCIAVNPKERKSILGKGRNSDIN